MNTENQKITDEELMLKIRTVLDDYSGLSGELSAVIGLVVMGHLMGWRFARLVLSRKSWKLANKLFGDLKEFLPENTAFSRKSVGLQIVDKLGGFWDYVRGTKGAMPLEERNALIK